MTKGPDSDAPKDGGEKEEYKESKNPNRKKI